MLGYLLCFEYIIVDISKSLITGDDSPHIYKKAWNKKYVWIKSEGVISQTSCLCQANILGLKKAR